MADNKSVAETLRAARDYIAEHGWSNSGFVGGAGESVCALGAVRAVRFGSAYAGLLNDDMPEIAAILSAIESDRRDWGGIVYWNDEPGRTQAEVEKGLLLAADRIEVAS